GSRAFAVRKAAAEALGRTKDERAVKHLVERYGKEKRLEVKESIVFGLSFHSAPEVLPVIQDALSSAEASLRYQGIMAAVAYGKKDTVAAIKGIFSSEKDDAEKMTAAFALYMLGDEKESRRAFMVNGLESQDPVTRFRAVDYIGRAGLEDAAGEIIKAREIENKWWIRTEMDRTLSILYGVRRDKQLEKDAEAYKFADTTAVPARETPENKTETPPAK
ncbi:MAG: HEAT repeat domain-containing protein, partial [Spirochaetota bacterium]